MLSKEQFEDGGKIEQAQKAPMEQKEKKDGIAIAGYGNRCLGARTATATLKIDFKGRRRWSESGMAHGADLGAIELRSNPLDANANGNGHVACQRAIPLVLTPRETADPDDGPALGYAIERRESA
jgi:hypothetical protein